MLCFYEANVKSLLNTIWHPLFIVDTFETTMGHRCTQINTDGFVFLTKCKVLLK